MTNLSKSAGVRVVTIIALLLTLVVGFLGLHCIFSVEHSIVSLITIVLIVAVTMSAITEAHKSYLLRK